MKKDLDANYYDNEYNPRLLAPQHEEIKLGWQSKSLAAKREILKVLDVPYGAGEGEALDVFPAAQSGSPVLVFIHGGYWRALDKSDFSFLAPAFVKAGSTVVIPNYALAPKVTVEHSVHQMIAALWWTYKNISAHGGDPKRIVVVGHSAGATMAALLMTVGWPSWQGEEAPTLIRSALGISGVYDMRPLAKANFLRDDLQLDAQRAAKLSPALLEPTGTARFWTSLGGDESAEFHSQAALLASSWPNHFEADIPMPGYNHFDVVDQLAVPGSALYRAAMRLLELN
jgi:arylformamidase